MTAARSRLLSAAHALYKDLLSPILHSAGVASSCRFQPTCSEYAALALAQHGPIRGVWLSAARLLRCHPFSRGGWDPVPPAAAPSGRAAHPGKASRPVVHFQSEGLPAPSEQPRQVP